jgi:hypothetical protein
MEACLLIEEPNIRDRKLMTGKGSITRLSNSIEDLSNKKGPKKIGPGLVLAVAAQHLLIYN